MATTSISKTRTTPGVYVTELSVFPPSIVGVATAVPIFIGYTETAIDPASKKQVYLQAIPLSSLVDYCSYFGAGFNGQYIVGTMPAPAAAPSEPADFEAVSSNGTTSTSGGYVVGTATAAGAVVPQFNLYAAMQLFFANGGGNCFVVSVNNYWGGHSTEPTPGQPAVTVGKDDLLAGLAVSNDTRGATMLVVPDACLLTAAVPAYADYSAVVVEMLRQSGTLQDRMAILDMPGALAPANWSTPAMAAGAAAFYAAIAPAQPYFSYGAAYGPALASSVLGIGDVDYTNLLGSASSTLIMNNLLTTQAQSLYTATGTFDAVTMRIAAAFPASAAPPPGSAGQRTAVVDGLLVSLPDSSVPAPTDAAGTSALDQYLLNAVPLLAQVQQTLVGKLNVAPPSGILAGIWTANDADRGVWNAPVNVSLNAVTAPKVLLADQDQGDYNVPLNGNAIDILRAMVNRGTVVWGARTLDGNSLDYRYIQVRRTLIYIEQSIKDGLQQFVFAANDSTTWVTVTATISNFLTQLWQAGGLMGDKASDAFSVQCGVPTTMTGLDVLNGYMIVNVAVQLIHPAEFIELTFTQTMQGV
jgi:phage tail sheath protein FI